LAKEMLIQTKDLKPGMVLAEDLKLKTTGEILFPAGICINAGILEILYLFPVEERCRIVLSRPHGINDAPVTAPALFTPLLPDACSKMAGRSFLFTVCIALERESAGILLHFNGNSARISLASFSFYLKSFWIISFNDLIPKTVTGLNELLLKSTPSPGQKVIPWNMLSFLLRKHFSTLPIKWGEHEKWEHYFLLTMLYRLSRLREPYLPVHDPLLLMPYQPAGPGRKEVSLVVHPSATKKAIILPFRKNEEPPAPQVRKKHTRKWYLPVLLLVLVSAAGLFTLRPFPFALTGVLSTDSPTPFLPDNRQYENYTGEKQSGLPHGDGTIIFPDGTIYSGEWRKGTMEGEGEIQWPSGTRYNGHWKDGMMHGSGTLYLPDGKVINGTWEYGELLYD